MSTNTGCGLGGGLVEVITDTGLAALFFSVDFVIVLDEVDLAGGVEKLGFFKGVMVADEVAVKDLLNWTRWLGGVVAANEIDFLNGVVVEEVAVKELLNGTGRLGGVVVANEIDLLNGVDTNLASTAPLEIVLEPEKELFFKTGVLEEGNSKRKLADCCSFILIE